MALLKFKKGDKAMEEVIFSPTKESLCIRILWSLLPISVFICSVFTGVSLQLPALLAYLAFIIAALGLLRAFRLYGSKLSIVQNHLFLINSYGLAREFKSSLIQNTRIETDRVWPFPFRQRFIFLYKEAGEFIFILSDLSEKDRLKAIKVLVQLFPEIGKDLQ